MLVEHKVFADRRAAVSTSSIIGTLYPMGTFICTDSRKLNQVATVLMPTSGTVQMFDTLRGQDGAFIEFMKQHVDRFGTSTRSIRRYLTQTFEKSFTVMAEGAELLDPLGNTADNHTIQLTALVDQDYRLYYTFFGAPATIEAKADELINEKASDLNESIFDKDDMGAIKCDERALDKFVMALAGEYFGHEVTINNITDKTGMLEVSSPFLREADADPFAHEKNGIYRLADIYQTNVQVE